MKSRLTDRMIASLKAPERGRLEVIDEVQPALRLRLTPNGIASWSIQTRINGRKRRFTIGSYPEVKLADARKRAARMLLDVRDGRDPVQEARAARDKPGGLTVAEAIVCYAAARPAMAGSESERALRRELAGIAHLPIADVTTARLAQIIDRKAESAPVMANRLVGYIKPFWRWASARAHTPVNAALPLEKPAKETSRDRVLSDAEIGRIWLASRNMGEPWGPLLLLLLLTAQRRKEVAAMRWEEIDLGKRLWTIPSERSKTKNPHYVALSRPAVTILKGLAATREPHGLVFTTTGTTPMSGFSRLKLRLDDRSGVSDWRFHDFRRTAVTHMADSGVDPAVADRVLNHAAAGIMSTVARVYQRSQMLDQRRTALDVWARAVVRAARVSRSGLSPIGGREL